MSERKPPRLPNGRVQHVQYVLPPDHNTQWTRNFSTLGHDDSRAARAYAVQHISTRLSLFALHFDFLSALRGFADMSHASHTCHFIIEANYTGHDDDDAKRPLGFLLDAVTRSDTRVRYCQCMSHAHKMKTIFKTFAFRVLFSELCSR